MAGKDGCVLGIDVGGTSIKAGLMTVGGEILDMTKIPTGEIVSDAAYQRSPMVSPPWSRARGTRGRTSLRWASTCRGLWTTRVAWASLPT